MTATKEQAEKHFCKCVEAIQKKSLSRVGSCIVIKCMQNCERWWSCGIDEHGKPYTHDDFIRNLNGLMEEFGIEVTND